MRGGASFPATSLEAFRVGEKKGKRTFVRSIEIIDETIKQVPQESKGCHPEVEWRAIAWVRDKVVHHCCGVDREIAGDVVVDRISAPRQRIASIPDEELAGEDSGDSRVLDSLSGMILRWTR